MNDFSPLPAGALVPPYAEADIRRCLGQELEKGRPYQRQGAVLDLHADRGGRRLVANVQGTRRRPYQVFAEIEWGPPVRLSGSCSCPVGVGCKHIAAVFLEALRRPPTGIAGADPLAGPLGNWLERLRRVSAEPGRAADEIVFIMDLPAHPGLPFTLGLCVARLLKSGAYGGVRRCPPGLETASAGYVRPEDRLISRLLRRSAFGSPQLPEDPETLHLLMQQMLATGRCRWRDAAGPALRPGPRRSARLGWRLGADGQQSAVILDIEGGAVGLPCAAPWYVDPGAGLAGPLEFDLPPGLVGAFLAAPPVDAAQAAALRGVFDRDFGNFDLPRPQTELIEEVREAPLVPLLRLAKRGCPWTSWSSSGGAQDGIDLALLGFTYDGALIDPASVGEMRRIEGGRLVLQRRDVAAERAAQDRLHRLGLGGAGEFAARAGDGRYLAFGLADPAAWPGFVYEAMPQLEEEGWRIEFEDGFRHRVVDGGGDWMAEVAEAGGWWFSLDLGIDVDGGRVPLLPVLADLLRKLDRADGRDGLDRLAHNGTVFGTLADGRPVALPLERTRAILAALVELYHPEILSPGGALDISAGEGAALAAIEAATGLRWLGGDRLRTLVQRLAGFSEIAPVAPPDGLGTRLRPYQQQGLDWLQFLRAFDLGGILADDMGLGKTVQALAHMLVEKREGRLDRPCLVVCPTSVVPNWCAEAARLAPGLRVLSLHGADRAARFCEIPGSDLVLTTYALLPRDAEVLLPIAWHLVVLDESQAIKNVAAKATQLACRLEARHRLCLTGTPVENHLGELWSQFAFLMPGLLGDGKRFARVFRNPIEKRRDDARRAVLAARVKPFLLRRTKALVAADLPPKNEIPIPLELAGPQRDLYETVRLAMHERVQREVEKKGFARSHIIILDALLKLRQVCCDPRLVKLAAARGVGASVKLAHLLEMLPPLIEEGRRILLFSQFTSMLDLITPHLRQREIAFAELRGNTRDRAAPVARFQNGDAPLFLISLRAGGTGLNLTAADTVIHYDPWWNPAVEDQATDRAHRIGQDKAVFVYKLLTQGTVEERMIELQQRKRALAAGIHEAREDAGPLIDAVDLERLFAPLPA